MRGTPRVEDMALTGALEPLKTLVLENSAEAGDVIAVSSEIS